MKKLLIIAGITSTLLMGCNTKKPALACTSPEAQNAVLASITEAATAEAMSHTSAALTIDAAGSQSIFSQLKMSIEDVRTSKEAGEDGKVSCAATLKIDAPAVMVSDADTLATSANIPTLAAIATKMGMTATGTSFKKEITFTAQATDDGKKIKADLFDVKSIASVPANLAYYALAKPVLDTKLTADAKAADDAKKAAYDKLKAANNAARKSLNELWKNLPPDVQSELLEEERAWVKQKDDTCTAEGKAKETVAKPAAAAVPGAIDTTAAPIVSEAEVARLTCDTKMSKDRFNDLQKTLAQ